jgi:hypothetical protein
MTAMRGVLFSAGRSEGASGGTGAIPTGPSSWEGPWLSCHPKNARKTSRKKKAGGIFKVRTSILTGAGPHGGGREVGLRTGQRY